MRRIFLFATLVAVTLSIAMGMGFMGSAIAQDDDSDDVHSIIDRSEPEDATEQQVEAVDNWATDEQLEALEDDDRERVESWLADAGVAVDDDRDGEGHDSSEDFVQEIDSDTRIVEWDYEPGMFTVVLEADEDTDVSITEGGDYEEGAGSFNYQEFEIDEGTNTVTMPVTDREGAGIALATRRSLAQGGGATLSIGQIEQNPFRHFGGESGLFSGVILTVGLAGVGGWHVVRSEQSGVVKA